MQQLFFILFLFLSIISSSCGKIRGCTDPLAVNPSPDAQAEDGSCKYPADLFAGIYTRNDTNIKSIAGFPDSTIISTKQDSVVFYRADNNLLYLKKFSTCSNDTLAVRATKDSLLLDKPYNCGGDWTNFGAIRNNQIVRYSYTIGEGTAAPEQVRGTAIMQ